MGKGKRPKPISNTAALNRHTYLEDDDAWAETYYHPKDLHCTERLLLA